MSNYFSNFPLINYSNNVVIDITKRVKLLDTVSKNPYIYYSYDIADSERPDLISSRYYEDSNFNWLIYLSNYILDPYYEWHLTDKEFSELLIQKYGSVEKASSKIKFYRNNWEDQDPITISAYSALTDNQKTYWTAEYTGGTIKGYKRKKQDWSASTNKMVSYDISSNSFIKDEICDIVFDAGVGTGQVIKNSNNVLILHHITGFYDEEVNANTYVYGRESQVNTAVTSVTVLQETINQEEAAYWEPITYYTYELEKNEYNATIRVIDSELKNVAADNLYDLLQEE